VRGSERGKRGEKERGDGARGKDGERVRRGSVPAKMEKEPPLPIPLDVRFLKGPEWALLGKMSNEKRPN
jgi:hypothetical protein